MKPIYYPRLVNGLAGDPVLYIDFFYIRRAVLFDCGNLLRLVPRQLLRVSDIFVTHTHVDHFIGFDQILRLLLGREKILTLYGPAGLIDRVYHKLQAYTWNLVQNYSNHFEIRVRETDGKVIREAGFICARGFSKETEYEEKPFDGILLSEPSFHVDARLLDHGIPSLGYVLVEHGHLGINKDRLKQRSLQTGPWLSDVKEMVRKGEGKDKIIEAPSDHGPYRMTLGEIEADLIIHSPGQRIAYVADCSYSKSNREKIIALAKDADYFFCEAAFLDEDKTQADKTRHLTARQAGELASAAGVSRLIPFHFSPRYQGKHKSLLAEAEKFFKAETNN